MITSPKNRSALLLVALFTVTLVASGCRVRIDTSGGVDEADLESKTFDVDNFDELRVGGAMTVNIEVGPDASMTVRATADDLEEVVVEQSGDQLDIDVQGTLLFGLDGPIFVDLTTPSLSELDLRGAVTVNVDDLDSDSLTLRAEGATTVDADGNVDQLDLKAEGASSIDLGDMTIRHADIEVEGASSIDLTGASSVEGSLEGASSVDVSDSTTINVSTSGASSIG